MKYDLETRKRLVRFAHENEDLMDAIGYAYDRVTKDGKDWDFAFESFLWLEYAMEDEYDYLETEEIPLL